MIASRPRLARLLRRAVPAVLLALIASVLAPIQAAVAAECDIVCENAKPGTPQSVWDISGAGDAGLQGFSDEISYNVGETAQFKIKTAASSYAINIYRLGWYGGDGARKVASLTPSAPLPQNQPSCLSDPSTGLHDCGNWGVSATWQVPADAVSGVYIAHLTDPATADESHITFVVRDDSSRSAVVFQTSDTTWQAYNTYGGANFYRNDGNYSGTGQARAFKLSYNRPMATRGLSRGRDFLFANEFPMLQFLERNGYDVSYISGVDTARRGALLKNHKVFVSTGHDEYWSGAQRANIEAARDAGVSLAFFSGNSVYWRTRYEPSIDGTATPYRTLVSYKETWSNAKIDPAPEWTGTWRDPRFATKAQGGGLPENALMGTAYMANNSDLPLTVLQHEGKMRLWRNTGLASMSGGSTALAPHTVGYESDEDLDNGFRPAGLIRLSTTTGPVSQYLRDYGSTVTPGTTTHNVTLYRAPSGALVFGAGTIQWAWGLSSNHDGIGAAADPRMQQATVNLLADMGAQATTLMAGLSPATATTDATGPATTITSPAAGDAITNGTTVRVTGTAADSGGQVAGVEVSTDGGNTWRVADGRESWTYSYTQSGDGAAAVMARAIDDSANIGAAATTSVSVACPCSLFGQRVPAVPATSDASAVEVGIRFEPLKDGFVNAIRFYKSAENTGTHTGTLWSATGSVLSTGTFTDETASGWQVLQLPAPVEVKAGTTYVASYTAPNGRYSGDAGAFTAGDYLAPPLKAPGRPGTNNGVYRAGKGFPTQSFKDTNYYVDVLFTTTNVAPPSLTAQSPIDGATSVPESVKPSATFGNPIDPASLEMTVKDASGAAVAGTAAYDGTTRVATFTPSAALVRGAVYTVSVKATSASGVVMPAAKTWSFTVAKPAPAPGVCPCSIWDDAKTPVTVTTTETRSVELGVKFTADVDGLVSGVRFYKGPKNTGTHTGSLWTSAGAQLATATFANESSTGWQTVTFASPVPVTAGTTYIASYRAPNGAYSADSGAFSTAGVDVPPLHVPKGGALFTYGTGAPTTASNANYYVDVVYSPADAAPVVTSTSPSQGATNVPASTQLTATFAAVIQSGSAVVTLKLGETSVAGATTYASATRTVSFAPSAALAADSTYTATVSGAKSLSGAEMAPVSWTFTTAGGASCPCTLFASDAKPAQLESADTRSTEVGTKFVPSVAGRITGVRFYKGPANTGTHTGSLWTATGTRLATATFSNETPSGWQTVNFATPVDVNAGTTYVVSYLAPVGRYSATNSFFATSWSNGVLSAPGVTNGVYSYGTGVFPTSSYRSTNYWVDPIFVPR